MFAEEAFQISTYNINISHGDQLYITGGADIEWAPDQRQSVSPKQHGKVVLYGTQKGWLPRSAHFCSFDRHFVRHKPKDKKNKTDASVTRVRCNAPVLLRLRQSG